MDATCGIYQRSIAAYRHPDRKTSRSTMKTVIESTSDGVPKLFAEIRRLDRTLKQRAADILAFFDQPGSSNGPTEAIKGRLEHPRGTASGFRNLPHYIARSLVEAGGFRPKIHSCLRRTPL